MSQATGDGKGRDKALSKGDIRLIMVGLMFVMMLAALETTIVGPALPTIGRDLGNIELIPWVVTAYLLVTTATTPLFGKMADIRGRRIVILFAAGAFLAGSVACAVSTSMTMLVFSRGLQGIGGGGIFAMTQTIIGDIVPPAERARYQVYTSSVWIAANLLGPVLGGLFAEHLHWSMIFWINLPLGGFALAIVWQRLKMLPRNERPHRLDAIGALLMMAATTLLLLAVSWGGVRYSWTSPQIAGLAIAAIVAWALLAIRLRTAPEPLIPIAILSNQVVRMATLCSFFAIGSYVGIAVYLPVYLQTIGSMTVADAGLATIPLMVFTSAGATIGALSMRRLDRYRIPALAGLAMAALAAAAMAWSADDLPLWLLIVLTSAIATGLGCIFSLIAVTLQSALARHDLGTTMALNVFLRSLGQALGVAALGAILLGIGGSDGIEQVGVRSPVAIAALEDAFRIMFLTSAAGFAAALFCLWRMEDRPLPGYGKLRE
ncbi:MAG: MFS transporter [Hyphomicrobiales bacterium]|nr:MFS transporter [Hyphomicrobiales bacterium]